MPAGPMGERTPQRLRTEKKFSSRLRRRGTTLRHHVGLQFRSRICRFGFWQFFWMAHFSAPLTVLKHVRYIVKA